MSHTHHEPESNILDVNAGPGNCCSPRALQSSPQESPPAVSMSLGVTAHHARTSVMSRLVGIPAGTFRMGSEDEDVNPLDGEGPVRRVAVRQFLIAPTTVTNAEFEVFTKESGYQTQAEAFGWSFVFAGLARDVSPESVRGTSRGAPWWYAVDGATWRHPEGPGSVIDDRLDHPVVHVSHDDALAYCAWSGTRLPTEIEWEYAARGGLDQARFAWGNELTPGGRHMCNIWQGEFPGHNSMEDGYLGTAPADSFPPNGYSLYNTAGNVWEWTSDNWSRSQPDQWAVRGGSYLCHASYCNRYRVAARTFNTSGSSSGNTGFRVAATSVTGVVR